MATLADVARLAGVTKATVSNVVNHKGTVSEKTRQKVEAVIRELGYQPNLVARSLAHGRTRILALVVNRVSNPFYAEFAEEVQHAAAEHGYNVLLYSMRQPDAQSPELALTQLYSLIDGLLVTETAAPSAEVQRASESGVEVVLCFGWEEDEQAQLLPSVFYDHFEASKLAARHLLALGHRDCAIIVQQPYHLLRLDGFRAELSAAGVELAAAAIQRCSQATMEAGYRAAQALLAAPKRPTAVFATNDLLAIGAMDAIVDHGLRVPEDISVVGFDDIHLAAEVRPALTTVALPRRELAQEAVELLVRHVEDKDEAAAPQHLVIAAHLVARQSTARPRHAP